MLGHEWQHIYIYLLIYILTYIYTLVYIHTAVLRLGLRILQQPLLWLSKGSLQGH
jgi:hypothetical protein